MKKTTKRAIDATWYFVRMGFKVFWLGTTGLTLTNAFSQYVFKKTTELTTTQEIWVAIYGIPLTTYLFWLVMKSEGIVGKIKKEKKE